MIRSTYGSAVVVNTDGTYRGVITLEALAEMVRKTEATARDEQAVYRAEARRAAAAGVDAPTVDPTADLATHASARNGDTAKGTS